MAAAAEEEKSSSTTCRYKLHYTVPTTHLEPTKSALFAAGAGAYPGGKYIDVCFETQGNGQFRPVADANPAVGTVGELQFVSETKVEVVCASRLVAVRAVEALKSSHPYEVVAYEVYKLEDL